MIQPMIQQSRSYWHRARGLTYGGVLAVCVAAMATAGCYTRSIIPAQNLSRITLSNQTRELVLRDRHGRAVRVGPNSKIRFLVRGGQWTPWVEGRRLLVNRVGATARLGREAPRQLARWSDIFAAEVQNLSGGKTYGAILVTTVLVGVVVLLIAGSAKGGGGKGLGKAFKGFGKGFGRGVGRALARGAVHHGFRLGVRLPVPHVHVSPGAPDPVDTTPPPPSPSNPPPSGDSGAPPPPPPPPPTAGTPNGAPTGAPHTAARPPTAWTAPLPTFSRLTNRRAAIRLVGTLGIGSDLTTYDTLSSSAFLGFRAYDAFEMALGARLYRHRGTRATTPQDFQNSWMAVLRLGAHLDLDARRWVALPIGVDVGGGTAQFHMRINLGIRIRVARWLHVGLYPFNPTYTHFKDETLKQNIAWWSFPTELELAFTF
jgi:hypothetical protein